MILSFHVIPIYDMCGQGLRNYSCLKVSVGRFSKCGIVPFVKSSRDGVWVMAFCKYRCYLKFSSVQDQSVICIDTTARIMSAVIPYGKFLNLSNLATFGMWLMAICMLMSNTLHNSYLKTCQNGTKIWFWQLLNILLIFHYK